jgi:hypothetical protein
LKAREAKNEKLKFNISAEGFPATMPGWGKNDGVAQQSISFS